MSQASQVKQLKFQKFIEFLSELGLQDVIESLESNGFDDWDTIEQLPFHFDQIGLTSRLKQEQITACLLGATEYNFDANEAHSGDPREPEERKGDDRVPSTKRDSLGNKETISNSKTISQTMILNGSCLKMGKEEALSKFQGRVTHMFLKAKGLTSISGLDGLKNLQILDLKDNHLKKIENIFHLVNLTSLNLEKNDLESIEGLENLGNLRKLYLSHNRISFLGGLANNPRLEILWISRQHLEKGKSLEFDRDSMIVAGQSLSELECVGNCLRRLENLEFLTGLQRLNLEQNELESFEVRSPL